MLEPAQLAQAAERVAAAASRPATVIVFGSYARGDATEASDLDRVVVEPELPDKAAVGRVGVGVDLLLFCPARLRTPQPGARHAALLGQEGRQGAA
jgi:uncharacterized protein